MIPEQQLIQSIQRLIADEGLERTPVLEEYAEQYAELAQDLVARLQRCAEYLDRGRRSEAVHEATSPPALLDLVEVVRFPELRKWTNIVADLGLASFPAIPMEIVERLRRESQTEAALAPLLKEYRRWVYEGDRDQTIQVLRRLCEADPQNPIWPENLGPLEEAQLPGLLQAAEAALAEGDRVRLLDLAAEFTHPRRLVPAPADILARLREMVLAERRAEKGRQGLEIAQRLRVGLAAGRAETLAADLAAWDELTQDDAFAPDEPSRAVVAEAQAAYTAWQQDQEGEGAFQQAVAEVREALAAGTAPMTTLADRLAALRQGGRVPPADLTAAVTAALARDQARARRRRRRLTAAVALGLILLVGGVALGLWRVAVQARRQAQVTAMEAWLASGDLARLRGSLEVLRERDPAFYAGSAVRHLVQAVEEGQARRAEQERRFTAAMAQLERLRDEGYVGEEAAILALLAEARQQAPDLNADRAADTWQAAWEDWRRRRRRQADDELARRTAQVQRVLAERTTRPFATLADEARALAQVDTLLGERQAAPGEASPETASAWAAAVTAVADWRRDLAERQRQAAHQTTRLAELRQGFPAALADLRRYQALLVALTTEFPQAPEAADYRRALEQLEAWSQVEALREVQVPRWPPGPDLEPAWRARLADERLQTSIWGADLKALLADLDRHAAARRQVGQLAVANDEMLRLLVMRLRAPGTEAWRPLYHPKPLMSRKETDAQGEFLVYWGQVYHYEAEDQIPFLLHTSKAFPAGLTTRQFEVRYAPRPQDNLVPQGAFLYGFIAAAAEATELDVHLLEGIAAAVAAPDLESVPRAWLVKRLLHLLATHFGEELPEVVALAERVRDLATEVPWMNPQHPAVVAAGQSIAAALREVPPVAPLIARVRARRALLAAALSRQVGVVGAWHRGRDGALAAVYAGGSPGPVWILTDARPGSPPRFLVAGTRLADDRTVLKPGLEREVYAGQVLFAPADGRPCRELFQEAVPAGQGTRVTWPASWPANERAVD